MKKVNLLYELEYNDVDVLLVPDEIANDIEHVVWEFNDWLSIPENAKRFLIDMNGKMVQSIDTKEFLWWLNHIKITNESKASVIKQHTAFFPEYPAAEF